MAITDSTTSYRPCHAITTSDLTKNCRPRGETVAWKFAIRSAEIIAKFPASFCLTTVSQEKLIASAEILGRNQQYGIMIKHTVKAVVAAGLFAAFACQAEAQGEASPPEKSESKSKPVLTPQEKAAADNNYLIPSPSDILSALGTSARLDWNTVSAEIGKSGAATKDSYSDDSLKALNFGVNVADAFVAVLAKDKEQFQQSREIVAKLATELSADKTLDEKSQQAKKLVEDGKWRELGNLLEEIRFGTLKDLETKDKDSFILASLGGWLRGLDLVTAALAKNYDAEATKVLRQPGLVDYLEKQVNQLQGRSKDQKEVQMVKSKMGDIKTLCTFDKKATLPQEKIEKLHGITSGLIAAIQG